MKINETFEIHDILNPKLFGKDGILLPDVRERLIEIVHYFEDYIEVPLDICDIQLVGSNVSYNYNNDSDLDVHIITNFDVQQAKPEIL